MIMGVFLSILVCSLIIHGAISTTMPLPYYVLGAIPISILIFLMIYVGFFAPHEAIKEKETTPE